MTGRIVVVLIVLVSAVAGGAMYWLQLHAFYERLDAGAADLRLTPAEGGPPRALAVSDFEGIDASSSPIRFRACFTLAEDAGEVAGWAAPYREPTPLIAPPWFGCFDAAAIGAALARGEARAFLARQEIADGVDRVVAIFPDGRAYAWHQLNAKYRD